MVPHVWLLLWLFGCLLYWPANAAPPVEDGDVAPWGAPDAQVNVADLLVCMQFVLGLKVPTSQDLDHGDLYPAGAPDGVIGLSDCIQLQKLVLPDDVTTPADVDSPTVPAGVSATPISATQVDVSWTASTDVGGGVVAGYNVFRSDAGLVGTVTGTGFSDTSVAAGTGYDYTVSAFDTATPANESAPSAPPVNVSTPADVDSPTVPAGVSATPISATQVDVSWTASTDVGGGVVAGYNVFRSDAGLVGTVTGTGFSDISVIAGTSYDYTVSAFDNATPANESAPSAPPVNVSTPADVDSPTVPAGVSATPIGATQVDVSWTASTDVGGGVVAGYNVFRSDAGLVGTVTGTGFSDTSVAAGTGYDYTVSAFDTATPANESAPSAPPVNVTTPADTSTPIDVQITQSSDDIEENIAGAIYFDSSDLEICDDGEFNGDQTVGLRFQNVDIPRGATITLAYLEFETDETASSATSVSIAAEANDNAAAFAATSFNLTGRPTTTASVPWNNIPVWNTIDQTHQSPDLSAVVGEVINRPGWSANNSLVFILSGTGTRIAESYDGEPAAAPSLHVEYTPGPPDTDPPTLPAGLAGVAVGSARIDLTWTASTDSGGGIVAGYNLYRDGGSVPIATVPGTSTSFSDTGLAAETAYSYAVSAFDNATPANESVQTAAVVVSTTPVDTQAPDVPGGLTATAVSDCQMDLSWTMPADNGGGVVTGYNIYRDAGGAPIGTVTGTGFSDSGLTPDTLYSYSVTAFDNADPANESDPAQIPETTLTIQNPNYMPWDNGILRVSVNGRYLENHNGTTGTPFFWFGDTAWLMSHRLSVDEADRYFADRKCKGVSIIQMMITGSGSLDGVLDPAHSQGVINELPFIGQNGSSPQFGNIPVTGNPNNLPDPTQPNEIFFQHVDNLIEKAREYGLYVVLSPTWGRYVCPRTTETIYTPVIFDAQNAYSYGEFLGTRYKDKPNIIWLMGGDRDYCALGVDVWDLLASGIKAAGDSHLISYHPGPTLNGYTSSGYWLYANNNSQYPSWLDFNMSAPDPDGILDINEQDYLISIVKPTVVSEANYFSPENTAPAYDLDVIRAQPYWSILSGAAGYTYGNNHIWWFDKDDGAFPDRRPEYQQIDGKIWSNKEYLNSSGTQWVVIWKNYFNNIDWWNLIPDQSIILVGENRSSDFNYKVSARTSAGDRALVYFPDASSATIDLSQFAGEYLNIEARWLNTKDGSESYDSTVPSSQPSEIYTLPSGWEDGLLILEGIN